MKFYVYRHIRLDTGGTFYVGKGSGKRKGKMSKRNKRHKNIQKHTDIKVEVVKYFDCEDEAYKFESELISEYKKIGQCEANYSNGGRRNYTVNKYPKDTSYLKTKEFREKMSQVTSGRYNGMYGKTHTDEVKSKLSSFRKTRTGRLSSRFKGYWHCGEFGKFGSQGEAERAIGKKCVRYRCIQSKSERWKNWFFEPIKE